MIPFDRRFTFLLFLASSAGCQGGPGGVPPAAGGPASAPEGATPGAGYRASRTTLLLATSPTHSCALREAGLFCWGQNFSGQLGTGDLVDSEVAVAAEVAGTDIVQVALATGRSCVRRGSGTVACWGSQESAQPGDGERDEALTATTVAGVDDAVDLALDDQTTCVVRGPERSVACWGGWPGANADEQRSTPPSSIDDVTGVVELRGGVNGEYCGRLQDDSVRCWSLKDGTWTAATEVPALSGARSIAMAAFAEVCAIVGAGPILCHNLENGKTVPLDESAGHVRVVGAGSLAACAVNEQSDWHCWNVLPPMLETVGSPRLDPSSDTPFVDLVFSGFRFCALLPDNGVACGEVGGWTLPALERVEGLPD